MVVVHRTPHRVETGGQVLADARVHAEAEAQPPRRDAGTEHTVRVELVGVRAERLGVAVRRHQVDRQTRAGREVHPVGQIDVGERPAHGDGARRLQTHRLVHATLQERHVGAGPLEVLGSLFGHRVHVVQGSDERGGAGVGAGQQEEAGLAQHHVRRQVQVVLVAQQGGEHIAGQVGFVAGPVVDGGDQRPTSRDRRLQELGIEGRQGLWATSSRLASRSPV